MRRTEKDTLHSTGNINMRRKVRFHYKAIINHWSIHTKIFPMTILLIESICQNHHTVIIFHSDISKNTLFANGDLYRRND